MAAVVVVMVVFIVVVVVVLVFVVFVVVFAVVFDDSMDFAGIPVVVVVLFDPLDS